MNIVITGVCGFIGFSVARNLLKKKNIKVIGIDNINNYYSTKLKKDRLKILKRSKNFIFFKKDIEKENTFKDLISLKIDFFLHFAAQAGVRYSIKYPRKYLNSNIIGFFNVIDFCNKNKIKKLIYASSSSVYGENKIFPLKEKFNINPINFYGYSKKNNEETAEIYSKLYNVRSIGLRFFTIYGEWGRPDMFMLKYLNFLFFKNPKFYLYNHGNHFRDFTYIGDAVNIIEKLIIKKQKNKHEIFNICSNSPIKITKIIELINYYSKRKIKVKGTGLQLADIIKTHGDNKKIKNFTNYKRFTKIDNGIKNLINWYIDYNKI